MAGYFTLIGFVFQSFNLWAHMTMLQNVIEAPVHVQQRPRTECIAEVSTRVIFLHAGRIEEAGPPAQIFSNPQTDRCRAFVTRHLNR